MPLKITISIANLKLSRQRAIIRNVQKILSERAEKINKMISVTDTTEHIIKNATLTKGLSFGPFNPTYPGIIEQVTPNTFRFLESGLYSITITLRVKIHETNTVTGCEIRPAVSNELVNGDEFSNIFDGGITTFRINIQVASDTSKESPFRTYDVQYSAYYKYTGDDNLFKVFVFGPNDDQYSSCTKKELDLIYLGD
jgi:hypothetical protein